MSEGEANRAVRILEGKRLKFTVRLLKSDGSILEWQSSDPVEVKFNSEDRCLWLFASGYPCKGITRWDDTWMLFNEENPT